MTFGIVTGTGGTLSPPHVLSEHGALPLLGAHGLSCAYSSCLEVHAILFSAGTFLVES